MDNIDFFLTDDDFYIIAKSLAHFATDREATISELADAYDLMRKIERLTMSEEELLEDIRINGEA